MELHGIQFDGIGFQLDISGMAARKIRKAVTREDCLTSWGSTQCCETVPANVLASVMGDLRFIVHGKYVNAVFVENVNAGRAIYVKYDDEIINFKNRQKVHGTPL